MHSIGIRHTHSSDVQQISDSFFFHSSSERRPVYIFDSRSLDAVNAFGMRLVCNMLLFIRYHSMETSHPIWRFRDLSVGLCECCPDRTLKTSLFKLFMGIMIEI